MHVLIHPHGKYSTYTLKVNTYIHPQSKYLHTPSKVNTLHTPFKVNTTHDVLVDLVHISEGGKMQISPKLELCRANQDQIRNQRPRLRRNRLFLGRKAGGGVSRPVPAILRCLIVLC